MLRAPTCLIAVPRKHLFITCGSSASIICQPDSNSPEVPLKSQCLISFGSNLGRRDCLISEAARLIADSPLVHCLETSRLFETPPIGGPTGQEPFLNAVAAFETDGTARVILEMLQATEQRLGRERKRRWDARSIDLDVVLHGELVGGGTGLIVPHPRYTARQFVLQPACDVAAHYRDPRFGWSIAELTAHLNAAPASIALTGGSESLRRDLCEQITQQHDIPSFPTPDSLPPEARKDNLEEAELQYTEHSKRTQWIAPTMGSAIANSGATNYRTKHLRGLGGISPDRQEEPNIPQATASTNRKNLGDTPWVSGFVPFEESLINRKPTSLSSKCNSGFIPRLIGRIQSRHSDSPWPAPHQMWPSGWNWPEYRLEIDDRNWAVSELSSAIDSMRCPVKPITEDGKWWI